MKKEKETDPRDRLNQCFSDLLKCMFIITTPNINVTVYRYTHCSNVILPEVI